MPGKRITDHQVHKYKEHRKRLSQAAAAAKTGISERSARRIERIEALPSQRPERHWRTRQDPLAGVWDAEVVPLLQADSALNSVTLLEELQRRYPGEYGPDVLRTLQRRVRQWRALHGAEREVYFAQEHPPGRLGLSDFTVADDLGVFIGVGAEGNLSHRADRILSRGGRPTRCWSVVDKYRCFAGWFDVVRPAEGRTGQAAKGVARSSLPRTQRPCSSAERTPKRLTPSAMSQCFAEPSRAP